MDYRDTYEVTHSNDFLPIMVQHVWNKDLTRKYSIALHSGIPYKCIVFSQGSVYEVAYYDDDGKSDEVARDMTTECRLRLFLEGCFFNVLPSYEVRGNKIIMQRGECEVEKSTIVKLSFDNRYYEWYLDARLKRIGVLDYFDIMLNNKGDIIKATNATGDDINRESARKIILHFFS